MNRTRSMILFTIVLAIYTGILATPSYVSRPGPPAALVGPLTGTAVLFIIVVILFVWLTNVQRKRTEVLETALQQREAELADIRFNLEQTIEKRTFEIAVVNASLNREIAERIQVENQTKALQKQMELILNSAGEGIFGLDTDGNVTFVNTAAALMLGWPREELTGQPHHEMVHHSHQDGSLHNADDCPIRQAYRDGIVHFSSDDVFWTREGTCFPVEYVSTPIIEDTVITGAVVVFRDLSTFS